MTIIKLKSNDGQVFDVDVKIACVSVTIKTMLDDLGLDEDTQQEEVSLSVVRGEILGKVLEWAKHHQDDATEVEGNLEMSEWDTEFLQMDNETLFELTRAANFLDVKGLLDISCRAVANLVKGKTPGEIRQVFGLP